jgi:D-3-phosphoglycerate dehydrogenase
MRVIAYDPYVTPERAASLCVTKVDLPELLARADIISLHAPLADTTRNILSAEALATVKPGVRIINCARGGLVDEAALYDAIMSGRVAGAALDVFAEEPARQSPLFELDEVVVTPHLGASTVEAQETVAVQIAEQMSDYLMTGAVINAVNMPSISPEEAPQLKPYLALAEQVGSFVGQLSEEGLRSVTITYGGHAATVNTRPLTGVILQGLLSPLLANVNQVSAPFLAQQRGIAVTTVHEEHLESYQTLIRLEVETEGGRRGVAGTLFGDSRPRLVEVGSVEIEAQLGPHMLFVRNRDQPGLIGALGTILGDAGLNIATFHLGRRQQGGDAIALVEVDQPVLAALVSRIAALPQVVEVKMLLFPSLAGADSDRLRSLVAGVMASAGLRRSA